MLSTKIITKGDTFVIQTKLNGKSKLAPIFYSKHNKGIEEVKRK
jgi:hypothetical protein